MVDNDFSNKVHHNSIKRYRSIKSSKYGKTNSDDKGNKRRELSLKSKLLSFSSNFIAGILVLSYAGYRLDEYFGKENHLYLLIGILLGIVWSIYETFKLVRFINTNNQ